MKRLYEAAAAAAAKFLCPTEFDRRRAVDTSARVRRARNQFAVILGAGMLILAPILNWWLAPVFAVQAGYLATLDWRMGRAEYPELSAAGGMLSTGACVVVSAAITGGPNSPLLPLVVVPVLFIAARFRPAVIAVGMIAAALAVIGIGVAIDPAEMIGNPGPTVVAITLIAGVGAISVAVQAAEVQHRRDAVLDPLTGMLNRKALESRFNEIEQQARVTGGRVCLIELDLDHFKQVNDSLGHSKGDAVLKGVAYELRKTLRTFELVYRIGGEEFLVIVPGADLKHGVELAERMRQAVGAVRPGGVEITISLGVATGSGEGVRFERLFAAADAALYEAKRRGRDQVATAGAVPEIQALGG